MDQTNAITWIGLVIGMIGAISPAIFSLLAIFFDYVLSGHFQRRLR
ncbi:hypothetical protein N9M22_05760 [Litoricolaceae bacterium]|nr:hypothetical protein [Litorivicinaceae bacterium]